MDNPVAHGIDFLNAFDHAVFRVGEEVQTLPDGGGVLQDGHGFGYLFPADGLVGDHGIILTDALHPPFRQDLFLFMS